MLKEGYALMPKSKKSKDEANELADAASAGGSARRRMKDSTVDLEDMPPGEDADEGRRWYVVHC